MFTAVIETTIVIAAPPGHVWSVLTDFAAYPAWNPFIRSAAGAAAPGETLHLGMSPDGREKLFRISPVVQAAVPGQELRWRGRMLLPGLFDAEHRFRLEPTSEGTRLHHAERFAGLLVPFTAALLRDTRRAFEAMNQALRQRCESTERPSA